MQRTSPSRVATVAGLYALVLWGHSALADLPRFGIFLACVTGAVLADGARRAASGGSARNAFRPGPPDGSRAGAGLDAAAGARIDTSADGDALRRLEAELHALEDQLRSAEATGPGGPGVPIGPWSVGEAFRG